ncbi:MAG: hypothetical protein KJO07_09820, partial [Deltaproteobacteria bacterium]|nr:hypothetical protein [Deltaproteobacteria bacterium]
MDQTRSLPKRSLEAARRVFELRSAGSADRSFFLSPSVTALDVERRGSARLVRCSVRVAITTIHPGRIDSKATILTSRATVLA